MINRSLARIAVLIAANGLFGCSNPVAPPSAPSGVSQSNPPAPSQPNSSGGLVVFKDPLTGLLTSDVRDARGHIVQFTTASELIWIDGTHLSGHQANGNIEELSCHCWLVVRFGAVDGQRRAYLTADYIHFNPGTVVAVEITAGGLTVSRTDIFVPGTYTLSGFVTELTDTGSAPIENAGVYRLDQEESGWDQTKTDRNGFYEIHGLSDGIKLTGVDKDGYQKVEQNLSIHGDMRFDVQLLRR